MTLTHCTIKKTDITNFDLAEIPHLGKFTVSTNFP